jgi:hypothetical protein
VVRCLFMANQQVLERVVFSRLCPSSLFGGNERFLALDSRERGLEGKLGGR